jgi:hypothetical protein
LVFYSFSIKAGTEITEVLLKKSVYFESEGNFYYSLFIFHSQSGGRSHGECTNAYRVIKICGQSGKVLGFSHENHVYQLLFGIGTLLSISYDECRRTKKGLPCGGSVTKNLKILLVRRASERP